MKTIGTRMKAIETAIMKRALKPRYRVDGEAKIANFMSTTALVMTTVSAAEDDDVYAVDDEMTLCMGLPVQQKL